MVAEPKQVNNIDLVPSIQQLGYKYASNIAGTARN
jgi:hypothetical protein